MKSYIKQVIALVIPLVCLVVFFWDTESEGRCAYVCLLMVVYWSTEIIPLGVTSLIPIILYPFLGILSTEKVSTQFTSSITLLLLASIGISVAFQESGLDRRIAYKTLLFIGTKPRRLLLSFIMTTSVFSMWISNTATTTLMLPIIDVICNADNFIVSEYDIGDVLLKEPDDVNGINEIYGKNKPKIANVSSSCYFENLKNVLYLSVSMSANVGGTATLIGTTPTLVLLGVMARLYPDSIDLTFSKWLLFSLPCLVLSSFSIWILLERIHLNKLNRNHFPNQDEKIRILIEKKYNALGRLRFEEWVVFLYVLLFILFMIIDVNQFLEVSNKKVTSASLACAAFFLFFLTPDRLRDFRTSKPILEWKNVEKKIPWELLMLVGGGLCLVSGFKESGLSDTLQNALRKMPVMEPYWLLFILIFVTTFLTEIISNTVVSTLVLPVVAELAEALGLNPLYFLIPVTVSCSYAFILPIATASNALVYTNSTMNKRFMMVPGFFLNCICGLISFGAGLILGPPIFETTTVPKWIHTNVSSST